MGLALTTQIIIAQVPSYMPTNGLVGYWPFNGNANDESGNGNNGTVNGANLTNDRFGNTNSAYSFDGSDIITANSINFSASISISIWYNLNDNSILNPSTGHPPSGSELIGQGTQHLPVAYSDFSLGISDYNNGTNQFAFEKSTSTGNLYDMYYSSASINFYNWTNILYSINLNVAKVYLNGTLVDSFNINSSFINSGNVLSFGARYVQNNLNPKCNFFVGILDDIGIWNRALTQEEITGLYYSENSCQSLVINTGVLSFNPPTYNNTVTIYPNPANDHITIDCGNLANVSGWTIKVVNTLGQEVFSGAMNTQQYVVPLNSWSGQGVYFVKIYDASNNLMNTKKIILQ